MKRINRIKRLERRMRKRERKRRRISAYGSGVDKIALFFLLVYPTTFLLVYLTEFLFYDVVARREYKCAWRLAEVDRGVWWFECARKEDLTELMVRPCVTPDLGAHSSDEH